MKRRPVRFATLVACAMFAFAVAMGTPAAAWADDQAASDPSELVTVIVQLEGDPDGLSIQSSEESRHEHFADLVRRAAREAAEDDALSIQSADPDTDGGMVVRDYYRAFDGFAITAPRGALDAIRAIDGVASAFEEHAYVAPEEAEGGAGGAESNAASLAMTGADAVELGGEGQVVAVIDTGVEVAHQAFSGSMDASKLTWTEDAMASKKAQLSQGGQNAVYVNEKIPFAWDYGDNDADPKGINEHGTHVAGIAVANAGAMRGTAPQAQLLAMRVARDKDGAMTDSNILAALDDAVVLQPDVINMSLGMDGGFFDDATNVYSSAFKQLETAGCTLCVSAGNAYYASYRDNVESLPVATAPDSATIASPSAHAESFSIASAENSLDGAVPYRMSAFSSWGPTPELKLKPEITGPGGNIYSSVYGNDYGYMSGTSMSSPHLAGLSALVKQHVETDSRFRGLGDAQRHALVTQLLMSTAQPMESADVAGSYYSPRHQGAGLANVQAALETDVYLTVKDAQDASRPKAELGSNAQGTWTFAVELHNVGNAPRTFKPDTAALSDQIAGGRFQMKPQNYTGRGIDVSYGGDYDAVSGTVTVQPGATACYTVSIACTDAFKQAVAAATAGTYVEGFAQLLSQDGAPDLSVPFLGFYGDWDSVPAFDAKLNSGTAPLVYASRLFGSDVLGGNPLGSYTRDADVDMERLVISRSDVSKSYISADVVNAPTKASLHTGLLRNAGRLEYTYRDADGKVVASYGYDHVTKSLAYAGDLFPEAGLALPAFDGYDAKGRPLPDGAYTLEVAFTPATATGADAVQRLAYTVYLDTAAPEVGKLELSEDGTYELEVADDTFIAGVDFLNPDGKGRFFRLDGTGVQPVGERDGKKLLRFEVARAALQQAWEDAGNADELPQDPALCVWDYGLNAARTDAADTPQGGQADADGFVVEDGVLLKYQGASTDVEIPDGVTEIAGAREGDTEGTTGAFAYSKVRRVVVPASVAKIGARAFYKADGLAHVEFAGADDAPCKLADIGDEAFFGTGLVEVDIPDSVKKVGALAFANTAVRQANIGKMARIDVNTFKYRNPARLVVRGASYYRASYETMNLDMRPTQSAYFANGVRSVQFKARYTVGSGDAAKTLTAVIAPPQTLVVPATCKQLELPANQEKLDIEDRDGTKTLLRYDPADVNVYAPEGTVGWNTAKAALEGIGADAAAQLHPIQELGEEGAAAMGASAEYAADLVAYGLAGGTTGEDDPQPAPSSSSSSGGKSSSSSAADKPAADKPAAPKAQKLSGKASISRAMGSKPFALGVASDAKGAKLSYKTSDKKVATVDAKGKVTLKGAGTCKVTVTSTAKGYQKATKAVTVKATLAKASLTKATKSPKKGRLTVAWKKVAGAQGYQVKVGKKAYTVKGAKALTKTVKAAAGKKAKVQVRAFSKASGKAVYGKWSAAKTVKVRK